MKLIIYTLSMLALLQLLSCTKDPVQPNTQPELIERFRSIPGIQVTEIAPEPGYEKGFELVLVQPVDHKNPDGQKFNQRMYLYHISEDMPMVFIPSGYASRPQRIAEVTATLGANQLYVTHRYMADARPNPTDWQYLNIEQAAEDHHVIAEQFRKIYSGKWISYGVSKNGMTALFHRRFYPEDVDATIALVAPLPAGTEDPRFDVFLENVGTESCRQRIKDYQRSLLQNRGTILPMIQNYMNNSDLHYNIDPGIILEYEVCEYPFAFFQYGGWDCGIIPEKDASVNDLYLHLEQAGGFPIYSDEYRDYYMPVYYQAYTELGWYRLINNHLKDLLVTVPEPSYKFFAPTNVDLTFRPEVMQDIINWLVTSGDRIIYIYGADDPWTAAAIELTGQCDALKIVQAGANHGVKIDDLDDAHLVYSKLEEWLNIEITGVQKAIIPNENVHRLSERIHGLEIK